MERGDRHLPRFQPISWQEHQWLHRPHDRRCGYAGDLKNGSNPLLAEMPSMYDHLRHAVNGQLVVVGPDISLMRFSRGPKPSRLADHRPNSSQRLPLPFLSYFVSGWRTFRAARWASRSSARLSLCSAASRPRRCASGACVSGRRARGGFVCLLPAFCGAHPLRLFHPASPTSSQGSVRPLSLRIRPRFTVDDAAKMKWNRRGFFVHRKPTARLPLKQRACRSPSWGHQASFLGHQLP